MRLNYMKNARGRRIVIRRYGYGEPHPAFGHPLHCGEGREKLKWKPAVSSFSAAEKAGDEVPCREEKGRFT